jgi:hypothetical protein
MTSLNSAVLPVAGPIGSGKTATATFLARRPGWLRAGYRARSGLSHPHAASRRPHRAVI